MSDEASRFTREIPRNYDRNMGPVLFVDFAEDMASRAAALKPRRVLETCAGTGIVTRRLRDLLPAGTRLTATDLNAPMLDVARGKFAAGEQVEFQTADAMALPFPDQAFDGVVCQFGVMFFPDKAKSFAEAYRVLKPGGHYLFSVWDAHRHNAFGRIAHQVVAASIPADPPQFFQVPFGYHQLDPVKDAVAAAGFTDLRVAVLRRDKAVPDVTGFARGSIHGSPVSDQIRQRGGDPAQVAEALTAAFRREFGDPGRLSLQTIFFDVTRPSASPGQDQ
jgi:ubiquinone/menaquinone biosynthesis C-methylase UbiE